MSENEDKSPAPAEHSAEIVEDSEDDNEASAKPKTEFERKLAMFHKMFQIFAITIAGVFAIFKFGLLDLITLQKHLDVTSKLDWHNQKNDPCLADLDIEVTNNGKSNVEIASVTGDAWFLEMPKADGQEITFSHPQKKPDHATSIAAFSYPDSEDPDAALIQRYVPGQGAHDTFEWTVPKKQGYYAVFAITLLGPKGEQIDHENIYDVPCNEEQNPNSAKVTK